MKSHPLYLFALDPTHIGAGGYRLGRVDNTILRDAATGLPKLPGSSINGAIRAASIYSLPDSEREQAMQYARDTLHNQNKQRPHPGANDPVARVFGYAEGDGDGKSRIGLVSFRDAEILAFPVPTMAGPRWITTPALLDAAGCADIPPINDPTKIVIQSVGTPPPQINLGWILLDATPKPIPFPEFLNDQPGMAHIRANLALVHDSLFPSLVNANLETRTSVSIDFETGAGADGLLFTYEAAPRGALYRGQVDFDDQRFPELYVGSLALVQKGLALACQLGLGAMTTRGFGRMQPMLQGV
ncbi:RAMP superfamily CRISPR-associated protein [Candidatus Contendibacter odensensis]|uniref:CRISPR-associated RAMP protein, Cmr4 family n=1 Tax=Candidatus Contendobacter odensis Run_B_J11 TaxID=1400861 RepID=A0A7U7GAP5_9GAMM|nr:RAMP superfamily CRISPR-associated protein [Candidatus Contendobacter odensis]CDH44675.1 putative CRISPR-associated RAMP protein, Cmr4 family [Candidatus Contendobacter odensis Run_B_J11]